MSNLVMVALDHLIDNLLVDEKLRLAVRAQLRSSVWSDDPEHSAPLLLVTGHDNLNGFM